MDGASTSEVLRKLVFFGDVRFGSRRGCYVSMRIGSLLCSLLCGVVFGCGAVLCSLFAASVVSCNSNSAFYKAMVRLGVLSKKNNAVIQRYAFQRARPVPTMHPTTWLTENFEVSPSYANLVFYCYNYDKMSGCKMST